VNSKVKIGIHTSIAGKLENAIETAHQLGCDTFQIFSSSPRLWDARQLNTVEAQTFRHRRAERGLSPLVIHDNYLINLASPSALIRSRSIHAFHHELRRALALGADYLVAHPGSPLGGDRKQAIRDVAQSLREAVRTLALNGLQILIENTAGQGDSLGARLEELRDILDAAADLPVGVCWDTAHAFASGYDIRTPEGVETTLWETERLIGLTRVPVIHANDSKAPLGSRVDRHQHIGRGKIGLEAFRRLLNHPALEGKAFILETPIDRKGDDRRNVRALKKLAGQTYRTQSQRSRTRRG